MVCRKDLGNTFNRMEWPYEKPVKNFEIFVH